MGVHNPKAVVDAMNASGIEAGDGIKLREFTLGMFPLLQKLTCPLLGDSNDGKEIKLQPIDIFRLIFILTRPVNESRRLIGDLEKFDDAAYDFADSIPLAEAKGIGAQIVDLFQRAMSTLPKDMVEAGKKKEEAGQVNANGSTTGCPAGTANGTAGS